MFKLVIEDDEGNRTIVPVIRDEISIGRRKGNTIRLNERNVSRDHARLLRDDKVVFLEDMDSRYKTLCNGIPIDGKVKFNIGDVFSIGDYALSLQSDAVSDIAGIASAKPAEAAPPAKLPAPVKKNEGTEIIMTAPGKLVVTSSNFAGQTFALTKPEMLIGRGETCDIIIDHRSVSTLHAKVVRDQTGIYKIVDLDSKNGIKVSGEEYQSIRLKRGDTIEMGHVRFRFVEPGENYVFAPQAMEYEEAFSGSSSSKPWLLPVLGLLLIVGAVGAYFAFAGGEKVEEVAKVVKKADNVGNIENIIEGARTHIRKGKIDKAISKLETAKMLTPNSGQTAVIDKLLSDAVIWSSLAKALEMGEDNLKEKRFDQALEKFKEISADTSTPIYQIMSEKGFPNQAISGLLKEAKAAGKDGRKEDSKRALHAILLYDSEHTEANKMIKKLGDVALTVAKKEKKDVVAKDPKEKTVAVKKDTEKKVKKVKKKFQKDPKEAKKLGTLAVRLMAEGNLRGAISKCREAQKHGYNCTRVFAVSYKNLGETAKACKYYKRLGVSSGLDCK